MCDSVLCTLCEVISIDSTRPHNTLLLHTIDTHAYIHPRIYHTQNGNTQTHTHTHTERERERERESEDGDIEEAASRMSATALWRVIQCVSTSECVRASKRERESY